jgi:ribonuclease D
VFFGFCADCSYLIYPPVINTESLLQAFLPKVESAKWIAMDTEADSRHAYPEKVCLLQIGLESGDYLIDPLAGFDLGPLWDVLADRELIFHGADYDLRLLRRQYGFVPKHIFDTMLAGRLVGNTTFGLRDLAMKYLGVELEKTSQTANWGRRPLTERMETYARNDTHYLKPLVDGLAKELKALDRSEWHREYCQRLILEAAKPDERDLDGVWRLKGSSKLRPRGLAVLRSIWLWREEEAINSNRPPYYILPHEIIISCAIQAEQHPERGPRLAKFLTARRKVGLKEAYEAGVALPESECPQQKKRTGHRATDSDMVQFDKLRQVRDQQAEKLKLDPTLVASKATLLSVAQNEKRAVDYLMKWQRQLLKLD